MEEESSSDIDRRAIARVGSTIGDRWRLVSLLGIGGMAAVYAAERVGGDGPELAAIKMLHPEFSADTFIRKRFVREGYVANAIAHEGAVKVYDNAVAEDGSLYLEMELLDGMTLEERCDDAGRLPPHEVIDLLHQLLSVLEDAHGQKILHRDLKPENLFLTLEGQLKVLDFGIARMRQGDGHGTTRTGDVMGTPLFMAPEQARGRWDQVDVRSDLWAVGAVAFTLLAGRPVHLTATATEALVKVVTEPVVSLASVTEQLPLPLCEWVDRALAFEQEDRFTDASSMREALVELSLAVLERPPASRIAYDPHHPLSQRSPTWPTMALAPPASPRAPGARDDGFDVLPTVVASAPGTLASPLRLPAAGEMVAEAEDTRPAQKPRWPWAAAVLLFAGAGVALLAVGRETPAPQTRAPATSSAAPSAPPLVIEPVRPKPSPEPAAPEPSEAQPIAPAPAPPRARPAASPSPRKAPPPDDPYGRRH